ncbi:Receptor-like serine/threonine-protein kinase SD1-8 [Linum perenne]
MKPNLPFFFSFISLFPLLCSAADVLTAGQSLLNNQTLLSGRQIFELGFFSPGESGNWYLGIWYKNIPERTYVWVANRDSPLRNLSAAEFKIDNSSVVVVDDGRIVWNGTGTVPSPFDNPVIQLLDSGNLVLRSGNSNRILWQSFDHPVDTLLPDMKLGWDLETGVETYLNSWAEKDDPGIGKLNFKMNYSGFPEFFLLDGNRVDYRSGPWNGRRFSGVPEMQPLDYISFSFVTSPKEVSYSFHVSNDAIYSRLSVTPDGMLRRYTWIPDIGEWKPFWYAPKDQCDTYRECGNFGICDSNASPVCKCVRGFRPRNPEAWELRDGSGGCARKTDLDCPRDKFLKVGKVKLPESGTAVVDRTVGLKECGEMCGRDCSCTAYAAANITAAGDGSGCVMWSGVLVDMRQYAEGGQDLYVRLAASDVGSGGAPASLIIRLSSAVAGALLLLLTLCLILHRKKLPNLRRRTKPHQDRSQDYFLNEPAAIISSKRDAHYSGERNPDELVELPLFDFGTMAAATDNFSDDNKLGHGGFGVVYKGTLDHETVVAIKRLSRNSGQGTEEFKNELQLIAKLQHRNLVRLLGCCVESDEKMLVYEYMENRSLDSVIFSRSKSNLLTWERRYNIICGIARGLLYLHQDSRFRIIHRDLKASNILLDGEWTPKISDFGMARIFGSDQTEACTRRVVGTYGYMSPEYAMDGHFSVKSDVFSFGVLVIEIVTGKKNRGFYHPNSELNLLGHCWKLWKEGQGLELVDAAVGSSYSACEALRCIHVGLLCVQERAEDRPTMASVLLMLSSETASLPQPRTPGFCLGRSPLETDSSSGKQDETFTVNQVTVTVLDAR